MDAHVISGLPSDDAKMTLEHLVAPRNRFLILPTCLVFGRADLAQCDLKPLRCGQCQRAGLECAGYRDVGQLRIRDESTAVRRKATSVSKAPTDGKVSKISDAITMAEPDSASASVSISSISIPATITTVLEQQAENAFFFHYVTNDLRTYSYLQAFLSAPTMENYLAASLRAVSLAFFSHW